MTDRDNADGRADGTLDPEFVTDWADWGKRQGNRWGEQAKTWSTDAWSWSQPQGETRRPWWSRWFWGIVGVPIGAIGAVLILAILLLVATAGLIFVLLAGWLAMGIISSGLATRRGWPGQLGALLGFALGPIGLFIVRRFPTRGSG